MDRVAGLTVLAWLLLLTVFWLIARWRKRGSRAPAAQSILSHPPAKAGAQSQATANRPVDILASGGTASAGDARWIAAGQSITFGDMTIGRGLFYLGRSLPTHAGYGTENAVVNPTLQIGCRPGNVSGHGVPYYPSYAMLDPDSRRAYLEWLASARDNPQAYIGYVFLYFYGLERRLILDHVANEHRTIVAEVQRLLDVYGSNRSFQMYASALLDAAAALTNSWPTKPSIDPGLKSPEIPLRLRGAIGAMMKRGEAISADWALAWYVASPDTMLRTPALRCFREFLALYRHRFQVKFPRGFSIRAPRRNLSVRYRAASGTFTATLHGDFEALPDIISLTAPLAEIDRVVVECTEALESYSRLIGRNPSARGTLAAELSLPKELLQQPQPGGAVARTSGHLESLVPKASAMVSLGELMTVLQIDAKSDEKNSKSDTAAIAAALENLGFAMEPDPRHGGPIPPREAEVMIFRQRGSAIDSGKPSPGFLAARAQVEIAVLVAVADGDLDGDEARAVIDQIRATPGLSEFQRARLIGYLGYLVRNPPNVRAVSRFKDRSLDERRALADIAVTAAAADGHLDVAEIKVLEKTYKTLGLPKGDLYRNLHELGAQDDEPPTVARGTPTRGVSIPPQKPALREGRTGITLDKRRIAKIQAETRAVKSILDQVFNDGEIHDDDVAEKSAPEKIMLSNVIFSGLDDRHASLLGEIVSLDAIDQAAFSELARKHGLFPAGAIEAINEWSFRRYEEAILDDGEPIEIARHLVRITEQGYVSEHAT
jgi:tellurite resistance protein